MDTLVDVLQGLMPKDKSKSEEKHKMAQLRTIFDGQGLQDSMMLDVLNANSGQLDPTVDALLELTGRDKFVMVSSTDDESTEMLQGMIDPVDNSWLQRARSQKEIEQEALVELMDNMQPPKHLDMLKYMKAGETSQKSGNAGRGVNTALVGGGAVGKVVESPGVPQWALASFLDQSVLQPADLDSSFMKSIKGLKNGFGENNCFLNVVIQSLFHLKAFRNKFFEQRDHQHPKGINDSNCPFCALKIIFTYYQFGEESALPPDSLRKALSIIFFKESRFQIGQLNDAAEVHLALMQCLHNIVSGKSVDSDEENCKPTCFVHSVFCLNIVEYLKCDCGAKQGDPFPYKEFIHYVSADSLRKEAAKHLCLAENGALTHNISFSDVISRVHHSDLRICKNEACKREIPVRYALVNEAPDVLTLGLVWTTPNPSGDFIYETLDMLSGQISVNEMFDNVIQNQRYKLRGMICYYGSHYVAYVRDPRKKHWVVFDDVNVRRVSRRWEKVVQRCTAGKFQPSIVWYEKMSDKKRNPETTDQ